MGLGKPKFTRHIIPYTIIGKLPRRGRKSPRKSILYMFYLSQEGLPLAVQHPEITEQ